MKNISWGKNLPLIDFLPSFETVFRYFNIVRQGRGFLKTLQAKIGGITFLPISTLCKFSCP